MFLRLISIALAALCVTACAKPAIEFDIPFVATFGGQPLACGAVDGAVQLTDLRFYVSEIYAVAADGENVPVSLVEDATWQQPGLAMIDLEDGSGACANGTPVMSRSIRGLVPAADYRGLRFVIGVPFDRNHGDPLKARPPLGDAAMHWHWRGGYKFLRAGVRTVNDGFWIHLGSTGCEGTIQNITGCSAPNRVVVELQDFNLQSDAIHVDLAKLVSKTDITDGELSDCSSGPAETACEEPFALLGLDGGSQRVFSGYAGH